MNPPQSPTLETIQVDLDRLAASGEPTFEIWIPEDLTSNGKPVPGEIAIIIMVERAKEVGYLPDSVIEVEGGGIYRFKAMT